MSEKEMLGSYVDSGIKNRADAVAKKLGISTAELVRKTMSFAVAMLEEDADKEIEAAKILSNNSAKEILKNEIVEAVKKEVGHEGIKT